MCLAVPGKVTTINLNSPLRMGTVDFGGVVREVCLESVPEAHLGDYVIVHAGFAISVISEQEAQETLQALEELGEIDQVSIAPAEESRED